MAVPSHQGCDLEPVETRHSASSILYATSTTFSRSFVTH